MIAVSSDTLLRSSVFALELVLALTLAAWLRTISIGKPVPWGFIFKLLLFGAVAAAISAIVEIRYTINLHELQVSSPDLYNHYGSAIFLLNIFAASLVEELAKYFIAVSVILRTKHFHRLSDSMLYLILIGLGFSLIEDALFFLNPNTIPTFRLLSFYLHSGTSAIIGYSLGRYKFGLASYKEVIYAICGAVGLHFAYNLATSLQENSAAFYATIFICILITLQIFILFRKVVLEEFELNQRARPKRIHRLRNL